MHLLLLLELLVEQVLLVLTLLLLLLLLHLHLHHHSLLLLLLLLHLCGILLEGWISSLISVSLGIPHGSFHFLFIIRLIFILCSCSILTFLHLEEHTVHFLHFCDSLFVFLDIVSFFLICGHLLPRLHFLHESGRVFASLVDTVDCGRVNVVRERRRVQLL